MDLVGIDDEAASKAVGTIAFRHARHPAVLSFPVDRQRTAAQVRGPATTATKVSFPVARSRLRGFRAAVRSPGHQSSDVTVAVCPRNRAEDAENAARALLNRSDRPDAIAAMSDQLAAGVIRVAGEIGLAVPKQLAVTGFDDDPLATRLALTTVRQSLRDQGAACARLILGMEPEPSGEWSVVERATTRPA